VSSATYRREPLAFGSEQARGDGRAKSFVVVAGQPPPSRWS
jgi:hypothetical protein